MKMSDRNWGLRPVVLCGASAVAMALSMPVYAQDADDAAEEEERIVVTGSRIPRDPNLGSNVPVESIDAEDLKLSGDPDIAATLIRTPSLLTSTTFGNSIGGLFGSGTTAGTGAAEDGEAILNLRGLGIERTLVLVDGRRHVAGVGGSAAVDINSIPKGLVERVEVMTGGASAIYGADAVSGVVNFILKKDFEGIEIDGQAGISGEGDGEQFNISGIAGHNFDDNRGNITFAIEYTDRAGLTDGDRDFSRDGRLSTFSLSNPALRFQDGDISAGSTPNFADFFSVANGRFPRGFRIPVLSDADFIAQFGASPTSAERALMDRAGNAPTRALLPGANFSITTNAGVVVPGSFFLSEAGPGLIDTNGNGISDCQESFVGFNSLLEGSAFGILGGCWALNPDGSPRIYQDGLIAGDFNHFGGDGAKQRNDPDSLLPDDKRAAVNLMARYELRDNLTVFGELKYVRQETEVTVVQSSFWDLLSVEVDNPFIPAALQPVADEVAFVFGGGLINPDAALHITKDPIDLGALGNPVRNVRQTYRFVGGFEGELENGWEWSLTANWGKFNLESTDPAAVIPDRFFAAIDVTTGPGGTPICESDLETSPLPSSTPFNIPGADPAILSFTPGDGSCKPIDIFGIGNVSQEAIDFVTATISNEFELEQLIFQAILTGDLGDLGGTLGDLFTLPGGPIGFAVGAEYREEESTTEFDPLFLGVIPVDTVHLPVDPSLGYAATSVPLSGVKGTLVSDLGLTQGSLIFDPETKVLNTQGSFDVWEFFAEISAPILRDRTLFQELTVDAAFRYSSYSTVGSTLTWKAGGSWTPVEDIRFRGNYSKAVRAPNIQELFSPDQGAFFRPVDPCDQAEIDALFAAGDPRAPVREANCRADGIPEGYVDPLSARFTGVIGGNPNLEEETAKTYTVGAVIQPRWIEGLSLFADYWNITIENAIEEVSANDIVSNCYDSSNFPNNFCGLFTRNRDPGSPQFLGFNFLRQTALNFGALETDGFDFGADYAFEWGPHGFNLALSGTRVRSLNNFFDPGDPTAVDPELGELQRPRWAGNVSAKWTHGDASVTWRTQYLGIQGFEEIEVETVNEIFGPAGLSDRTYIHDISAAYQLRDSLLLYGGVNNVTDEIPFISERGFPVSPLGRFFFIGATWTMK